VEPRSKLALPRAEVREGRSFNPDEFAIALEQVVAGRGPEDYRDPQKFFARTSFTRALSEHAGMVLRRLAGQTANLAWQLAGAEGVRVLGPTARDRRAGARRGSEASKEGRPRLHDCRDFGRDGAPYPREARHEAQVPRLVVLKAAKSPPHGAENTADLYTGGQMMTDVVGRWLAAGLVAVVALGPTAVGAQSIRAGAREWTLAAGGGASLPNHALETVTSVHLLPHVGYFVTGEIGEGALRGNFELLVEPTLIYLDASNSATVVGVAVLPRWLFAASPRVRPYLEMGAGVLAGEIDLRQTNWTSTSFSRAGPAR
jgi:hypothetical protein